VLTRYFEGADGQEHHEPQTITDVMKDTPAPTTYDMVFLQESGPNLKSIVEQMSAMDIMTTHNFLSAIDPNIFDSVESPKESKKQQRQQQQKLHQQKQRQPHQQKPKSHPLKQSPSQAQAQLQSQPKSEAQSQLQLQMSPITTLEPGLPPMDKLRGSKALPPKELFDQLINLVLKHGYVFRMPIIHKPTFLKQLKDKNNQPSLLLLNAMLAAGSLLCNDPRTRSDPADPQTTGEIFYRRALGIL
jgi:hypothetical protein